MDRQGKRLGVQAALVALALLLVLLVLLGCSTPSSYVLVGERHRPVPPSEVRIYLTPPAKYEEIAVLQATSQNGVAWSDQERMDIAIDRLKATAASLGANGILFQGASDRSGGSIGMASTSFGRGRVLGLGAAIPLWVKSAQGIGIYVEPRVDEQEEEDLGPAPPPPKWPGQH